MARKPTSKEPGTDIVDYEAEMAALAGMAKEAEKLQSGGSFFSTKAGVLAFGDTPLPGNQMAVVILDGIVENVYYGSTYSDDNRAPPKCFAFGREDDGTFVEFDDVEPHKVVDEDTETFERQHDQCKGCWANEWGSADVGRGKACGNRRRLAVIPAGSYSSIGKGKGYELTLFDDEEIFAKADMAFLKLPVMSVKGYSQFVHSVAEDFKRPPSGVFARVWLEPDQKSQFRVNFEVLEEVPKELLRVMLKRAKEAQGAIAFPYQKFTAEEAPAAKNAVRGNSKLARKPAAAAARKR